MSFERHSAFFKHLLDGCSHVAANRPGRGGKAEQGAAPVTDLTLLCDTGAQKHGPSHVPSRIVPDSVMGAWFSFRFLLLNFICC